VLEDIEDIVEKITCHEETVEITFSSQSSYHAAAQEWIGLKEVLIITSHEGCNVEGERGVYEYVPLLHPISSRLTISSLRGMKFDGPELELDGSRPRAVLRLERTSWKKSISSVIVGFGNLMEGHTLRKHKRKARRGTTQTVTAVVMKTQDSTALSSSTTSSSGGASSSGLSASSPATSSGSSTSQSASSSTLATPVINKHIALNFSVPTSSGPVPTSTPLNINFAWESTGSLLTIPVTNNADVSFGCKNCNVSGSLELVEGSFAFPDLTQLSQLATAKKIFQNASIELNAPDGFHAYVELQAVLDVHGSFEVSLFDVPVQAFTVSISIYRCTRFL
jgi:hypothetical protein